MDKVTLCKFYWMKQFVLLFSFVFLTVWTAAAQSEGGGCGNDGNNSSQAQSAAVNSYVGYAHAAGRKAPTTINKDALKLYPNPAIDFINLNNEEEAVREVVVFSVTGRQMRQFDAVKGKNEFQVSDLPKGMYLVQLLGQKSEILLTQRLNKR